MAASTLLSNPNRHRVQIHPTHQSANTNPVESNNNRNDNYKSKDLIRKNIDTRDLLIQNALVVTSHTRRKAAARIEVPGSLKKELTERNECIALFAHTEVMVD